MNWMEKVNDYEDDILNSVCDLLMIPSVLDKYDKNNIDFPFGEGIRKSLDFMLDLADKDGFTTKNINNYAGHIEYGEGEEILGVLCHLDVVPTGDGWKYDPFSATIEDDKIYARGAIDDKGPTMAAYYALKMLRDSNVTLNKRVRIILGTDEETAWRGIKEYFKQEEMPKIGFAPDANFPLIYGEKGIFSFDILGKVSDDSLITFKSGNRYNVVPDYAECTLNVDLKEEFEKYIKYNNLHGEYIDGVYKVYGKSAHGAQPNLGVNSAFILADFLNVHIDNKFVNFMVSNLNFDPFGEKLNIDHFDEEMKHFTINVGVVEYESNEFKIGVNCRYPNGWDRVKNKESIKNSCEEFGFKYDELSDSPIHYVSPDDDLVKTLHNAYKKYTNDELSELLTIGGGTYSRALKKAVAFGPMMPGREDVVHQVNEYIIIDDLLKTVAIYAESIENLCK